MTCQYGVAAQRGDETALEMMKEVNNAHDAAKAICGLNILTEYQSQKTSGAPTAQTEQKAVQLVNDITADAGAEPSAGALTVLPDQTKALPAARGFETAEVPGPLNTGKGRFVLSLLTDPQIRAAIDNAWKTGYSNGEPLSLPEVASCLTKIIGGSGGEMPGEEAPSEDAVDIDGPEHDAASENQGETINLKNINDYIAGNKDFDNVLNDYAKLYAKQVNSNQQWRWGENIPGGENLTVGQKAKIKATAIKNGDILNIGTIKVDGKLYADFKGAGVVKRTLNLPTNMWYLSDNAQFKWLDEKIGGHIVGYTWHHSEMPGEMQLVPFGIHNITYHNGGRSAGMWADAPR